MHHHKGHVDTNIPLKIKEKEHLLIQLVRNLQLLYPDYGYKYIPIIIGTLGFVSKFLKQNLDKLEFQKAKLTVYQWNTKLGKPFYHVPSADITTSPK